MRHRVLEWLQPSGTTPEATQAQADQMNPMTAACRKPLCRAAFAFAEPVPAELVMTAIPARLLRRKA